MLDLNRRNMTAKDKISRLNFKAYLPYQGETRHQVTGACLVQSSRHTKRYIVQSTNEAEIRLGEQSENTESCRENLWNEIQVKGP